MGRIIRLNEDGLRKKVMDILEEASDAKPFKFTPSSNQTLQWKGSQRKRGIKEGVNSGLLHSYKRLDEASLNRMLSHGKTGMVIVSSNRSDIFSDNPDTDLKDEYYKYLEDSGIDDSEDVRDKWLSARNKKADSELRKDIQAAGYSYTPVYGGYHGSDSVVDSFEPSYVVYNHSRNSSDGYGDFKDLFDFAIAMCRKYRQDSVYVQAPGEPPMYVDCNGNKVSGRSSLDFIKNDPSQEFYTTNKRKKRGIPQRFTGDISFGECYVRRCLTYEYVDRMRRSCLGEVFVAE